jgi:hypothetical protein
VIVAAIDNAIPLRQLSGMFVGGYHNDRTSGGHEGYRYVPSIDGAQGVTFQCPKCAIGKEYGEEPDEFGVTRGFARGAHHVLCWLRNPRGAEKVPDDVSPGPGRWWIESGETIETITFGHGEPFVAKSVLLAGGCGWHGFIVNGAATLS